jgi:type I restriction enzyme S subunit
MGLNTKGTKVTTDGLRSLPEGWAWTTLREVAREIYRYPTFYGMEHLSQGVPVIRGEHILEDGRISHDWGFFWYVAEDYSKKFPKTIVDTDDLIMSVRGSVGKLGIVDKDLKGAQVSPNCIRIATKRDQCLSKYLFYYLKSSAGQLSISDKVNATTIQTIKASSLSLTAIPLPPLPEQDRIVARLEELLSDLEAGVRALERARAGAKRYKASVLKAAVEGKLLESRGTENSETGLPEGWRWVKWADLVEFSQNGFGKRRSDTGAPTIVLRLADVSEREIRLDNARRVGATEDEIAKYVLAKNDMICVRVNGSLDNVGRMILFTHAPEPITYCDHFIRFRLNNPDMAPFYAMYFDTERARKFVELNRVSSAGQNTISQGTLLNFDVPLPPLEEQRRIVAEVERRLEAARQVEAAVEAGSKRARRLRQAVLKAAFEGRLG